MAGNFNINGFNLGKATIVPNISRWNMLYHNIMRPIWAIFPKIKPAVTNAIFPMSNTEEYAEAARMNQVTYLDSRIHDITEKLSEIEQFITGKPSVADSVNEIGVFIVNNFTEIENLFSVYYGMMNRPYISVMYVPNEGDVNQSEYDIPIEEKYGRYIKFIIDLIFSDIPDWSIDNWNENDMRNYYAYKAGMPNTIMQDDRYASLRNPAGPRIFTVPFIGPRQQSLCGGYKKSRRARKSRKARKTRKSKQSRK